MLMYYSLRPVQVVAFLEIYVRHKIQKRLPMNMSCSFLAINNVLQFDRDGSHDLVSTRLSIREVIC